MFFINKWKNYFYKIWKFNGKGYDKYGNIIYVLINGNGKVKNYWSDDCNLKFEGEYLNDKKNGKGKEYDYNGKLKFEGEFLDDKRMLETQYQYDNNGNIIHKYKNGNWKEYDYYGDLVFEGWWKKWKRKRIWLLW